MNLRQIEAFQAVIMTGSVTLAAELLNLSQPAVSRHIDRLGDSCRFQLFARVGRGLQPTSEALAFYEEVKRSFVGLGALQHAADSIANFNTGHLRIASLPVLGIGFLTKTIAKFSTLYPKVTVSLLVRSAGSVRNMASTQQFDLGFLPGPAIDKNLGAKHFASVNCVCILPQGHRLAEKASIVPEDLRDEPFISFVRDDLARRQVDHIFKEAGVRRKMHIETQFAATVCNFVINGAGVSILSPFAAMDSLEHGLLIKPFRPAVTINYFTVVPTSRPDSAVAKKFITVLEEHRDEEFAEFKARGF